MSTTALRSLACVIALGSTATGAMAHATLESGEATIGSAYKGVVRIGHGCDGAATLKVRVRIPDGLVGVKPMPKPGWTLETVKGPYATPYTNHGATGTEGVREISWTGKLLDENYDEFVFRGTVADSLKPGAKLYVPIVQECEGGKADRWIEIPAEGKSSHDLKSPAPAVKLLPAQSKD
ncbi:YcnI family protein [Alsobacter sp. SYSU M60028]|uniref:YcnI family protein n=1 Tax=Alsobacter ponti TaxID=2962936 RepID=A0ABT1L8J4_9HYPH|nr:DUF1775 domain-containing protein [Alsobacter ponti]MCP8937348.1 YcnI family protein [Alsobacter ponti]